MPYTPISFSDGVALSAAQLNTLAANDAFFAGLTATANIPFVQIDQDLRTTLAGNKSYYQIRHRAQYLNLYVQYSVVTVDHLAWTLKYGAWTLASDDPIAFASPVWLAYDVTAAGAVLGTWYEIEIDAIAHNAAHAFDANYGASYFRILRMFESDTDYS